MLAIDINATSSCSSIICTGMNIISKTKKRKKRVGFSDEKNQIYLVPSVVSMVSSRKELSMLWLTPRDWQHKKEDFQQALSRRCPTVHKHQPTVQARRSELTRQVYLVVLGEQYHYRRDMLDSDKVDRTSYENRMASMYSKVSKKARHEAFHDALRLQEELAGREYISSKKRETKVVTKKCTMHGPLGRHRHSVVAPSA
jgi:hypothetical protein